MLYYIAQYLSINDVNDDIEDMNNNVVLHMYMYICIRKCYIML